MSLGSKAEKLDLSRTEHARQKAFQTPHAQGIVGAGGRRRLCRTARGGRAGANPAESGHDPGRPQGGYARVLHGDGTSTRGRAEQGIRSQVSRNQGSREAIGAERVFQRIGEEGEIRVHEVDVVCSTDAGHFVRWRREDLLAPFLPEDAARHLPPDRSMRMVCTQRHSLRSAQLATTPIWSSPRMPRRLSPICSTLNGRAKSSKEIRTTAAPSLPRRLRSRASWAGPISRGSPSRRSCRWSHRAIHRIGSPAARVPCKPTVPTPNFCCCESEARRWKLFMPARARR